MTGKEVNLMEVGEVDEKRPCDCPDPALPPDVPIIMPYEAIEENIGKLREWIINSYKAFNVCTHHKLPIINSSPPLMLYVDPKARPLVCNKPRNNPLHLQTEVKVRLDKDKLLGVLDPVGKVQIPGDATGAPGRGSPGSSPTTSGALTTHYYLLTPSRATSGEPAST